MVNPKSLSNLRPFKKGQSGNPGGLPKGTPKISTALVRFLAMPPRIFHNYKPRSVAEEIAKRMIELAIDGRPSVAIRASVAVADRTCGKVGYATYLHYPNGEIRITYDDWQPPELELERGDVIDSESGVLYPAGSLSDEDAAEVA
jgi:uncharacterized protein DUF5681